jgi:hypothetical protein
MSDHDTAALFELTPPSAWEVRDFHGYRQTREGGGPWRFYVAGFSGSDDEVGRVLMSDGTYTHAQLDERNRLQILGRWYSDRYWDH